MSGPLVKCAALDGGQGRPWLMMGYCALEQRDVEGARRYFQKASAFPDQEEKALALINQVKHLSP